jgi:hypothetical protein
LDTTQTERRLGALVHIGGIFGPIWLPLAAWFAFRRKSAFVAAHAWQEFRGAIFWKALLLGMAVVSLSISITRLVYHFQTEWREFTWQELALRVAISLFVLAALWVWNLVQALVQARAALQGVWPKRARRPLVSTGEPEAAPEPAAVSTTNL